MTNRYPGYDVLDKRLTSSWNDATRAVIDRRLAIPREARFFTAIEWACLFAVCARILPQPPDRPAVPLAAFVDEKMATNKMDGYRYAGLPDQGTAWRIGLTALDAEAISAHQENFSRIIAAEQDALLRRMQRGELNASSWSGMPCALFFKHRLLPDITHAYYAHPTAWSEIGFGGPASPRGYVRMGLNRRDPWEAVKANAG